MSCFEQRSFRRAYTDSSSSGRICVPVEPDQVKDFDPEAVPTISTLLSELETTSTNDPHHSDWERTSLKPYVDILERHSKAIIADQREAREGELDFDFGPGSRPLTLIILIL